MANADQIKALIKSFLEQDEDRFLAVAMQVAANQAKRGNAKFASELREIIDEAKAKFPNPREPIPINRAKGELTDLLSVSYPKVRLSDMVLPREVLARLSRILKEQRSLNKLQSHGLRPRRKLLLVGPPGCGKTMTASVLAGELGIPLFVVRLDGLITKYLGETTSKLRIIFDAIAESRGVYLFDEFDSIGTHRGFLNEVGEIRRVLNSFLMYIENDRSNALIVCATNHPQSLDDALYRRFDDVISYNQPEVELIEKLLESSLKDYSSKDLKFKALATSAKGLSFADISEICKSSIKEMVIHDRSELRSEDVSAAIQERQEFRSNPNK